MVTCELSLQHAFGIGLFEPGPRTSRLSRANCRYCGLGVCSPLNHTSLTTLRLPSIPYCYILFRPHRPDVVSSCGLGESGTRARPGSRAAHTFGPGSPSLCRVMRVPATYARYQISLTSPTHLVPVMCELSLSHALRVSLFEPDLPDYPLPAVERTLHDHIHQLIQQPVNL